MGMVPFMSLFPDLGIEEMRTATVLGDETLPDGQYGFLELYCDDPRCDCRRVVIQVVTPQSGSKIWATINYGWESAAYYAKWMGSKALAKECQGPTLDPLNRQSRYAPALLDLFQVVISDRLYVERLKRHYEMFRAATRGERRPERESPQPSEEQEPPRRKRIDLTKLKKRRRGR
jgi:hypothetical protein